MDVATAKEAIEDFACSKRYSREAYALCAREDENAKAAWEHLPGYPIAAHRALVAAGIRPSAVTIARLWALRA